MKLKVKRIAPNAVLPKKNHEDDTGYDIVATSCDISENYQFVEYGTGLIFEPEHGWGLTVRPRSSISKYDLLLCNSVGTIDHSYRGELKLRFKIVLPPAHKWYDAKIYAIGDRIAQMMPEKIENIDLEEVEEITASIRGSGGFGSTGT